MDASGLHFSHKNSANSANCIFKCRWHMGALRKDTMAYTVPSPLTLEKVTLIIPGAITAIERAIKNQSKISTYLTYQGNLAMKQANIFLTLNK